MFRYNQREKGIPKKTRDILIIAVGVLLIVNAIQFLTYQSSGSRGDNIRRTLVIRLQDDVDAALSVVPQLGRTGGSSTMKWLSLTRQYLYGMTQINDLAAILLGDSGDLVPRDAINTATRAIDDCEQQLSSGNNIDTQLNTLWAQLAIISKAVEDLVLT